MVIISQDKEEMVNLKIILSIKLYHDDEDNESLYEIYTTVNAPGDNYILLGVYKTEERAKEVLNEIAERKSMFEYFKCVNSVAQELIAESMKDNDIMFDTYEMPKE